MWAWLCLAVGFLGVALAPYSAGAQMLRRASHHLSAGDRTAVRVAAQALLPKGVGPVISGPCRNPDSARAWISTAKIRTALGVQQWREFSCSRGDGPWQCAAPEFKQRINVSLTVREKPQRVEINFDEATCLERARALAGRALAVYADAGNQVAACDNGALQTYRESQQWFWTRPIVLTVSHDGVQDQVYFEGTDVVLEFSGTAADRDKLEPLCWGTMIVVT